MSCKMIDWLIDSDPGFTSHRWIDGPKSTITPTVSPISFDYLITAIERLNKTKIVHHGYGAISLERVE